MKKVEDRDMDVMIGSYLRMYREKADLMQEDVAKRLGVTTAAVSAWECGIRATTAKTLLQYIRAVGADPNEVIARIAKEYR